MSDILTDFSTVALARAVRLNLHGLFRRLSPGQDAEFPGDPSLAHWHTTLGHPWFNGVIAARPATADDRQTVVGVTTYFQTRDVRSFSWWLDPALSKADWESYLLPRGFGYDDNTPGMAADLFALNEGRAVSPGLEIVPVTDLGALREWTRTFVAGYGIPADWEHSMYAVMAALGLDLPVRNYLGLLGGAPVAASTLFLDAGVAGIYCVATLPEARGRGLGSAVTLAPLQDAREMGYRIGVLQSSDMGYKVYQGLGFREVCRVEHFTWSGQPGRNGSPSSPDGER